MKIRVISRVKLGGIKVRRIETFQFLIYDSVAYDPVKQGSKLRLTGHQCDQKSSAGD